MPSIGPILHSKVYAKFVPKGDTPRGSIYVIVHDFTSTSELDIDIISIGQHVQFIRVSEVVSAAGPIAF